MAPIDLWPVHDDDDTDCDHCPEASQAAASEHLY